MKASAMIPAALRLASGRQPIAMPRYTEASSGRTVTDVTRLARLLLVDDSRGDVILARRNLLGEGGMGCELSVARTAAEAMEILIVAVGHGRPIDLILLDIGLPGENGFSLLDRIRMTPRLTHTPVIVCSGSGHETDRRQAAVARPVEASGRPAAAPRPGRGWRRYTPGSNAGGRQLRPVIGSAAYICRHCSE
ncbi:MAG: response regulator [Asticcacaulis sp.]|nr:response regulator [Asticcacaulis sp.]